MPLIETVKQPTKPMVWDSMSFCDLSYLRIVPHSETDTSGYYVEKVLNGLRCLR